AHYDYWSDTVKRSIVLDSKADLVAYGMGEQNIVEIARRLAAGKTVRDLRDLRGVAYALGAKESTDLAQSFSRDAESAERGAAHAHALRSADSASRLNEFELLRIPSFEQVRDDKLAFAEATRLIHSHTNPFNAAALVQLHDRQAVVQN